MEQTKNLPGPITFPPITGGLENVMGAGVFTAMNTKKSYSEKLLDPRWQRKRLEIMGRDDFKCRSCRRKDETLHVHHLFYRKGAEPWDYGSRDLLTVCKDCHAEMEEAREALMRQLTSTKKTRRAIQFLTVDSFGIAASEMALAVSSFIYAMEGCHLGEEGADPAEAISSLNEAFCHLSSMAVSARNDALQSASK